MAAVATRIEREIAEGIIQLMTTQDSSAERNRVFNMLYWLSHLLKVEGKGALERSADSLEKEHTVRFRLIDEPKMQLSRCGVDEEALALIEKMCKGSTVQLKDHLYFSLQPVFCTNISDEVQDEMMYSVEIGEVYDTLFSIAHDSLDSTEEEFIQAFAACTDKIVDGLTEEDVLDRMRSTSTVDLRYSPEFKDPLAESWPGYLFMEQYPDTFLCVLDGSKHIFELYLEANEHDAIDIVIGLTKAHRDPVTLVRCCYYYQNVQLQIMAEKVEPKAMICGFIPEVDSIFAGPLSCRIIRKYLDQCGETGVIKNLISRLEAWEEKYAKGFCERRRIEKQTKC